MAPVSPEELVRPVLLLAHLLCFAAAAAGMAFCDYALLVKRKLDLALLQAAASVVAWSLAALWLSGLAVVWLDTGLEPAQVLARPKLLAKLSVVGLLTINGVLLHGWAFPKLLMAARQGSRCARGPVLLGALSAASWVYAVFLGVAGPLAPLWGYAGFMLLYGACLLIALGVALTFVHPRLARRLMACSAGRATAIGRTVHPKDSTALPQHLVRLNTARPAPMTVDRCAASPGA